MLLPTEHANPMVWFQPIVDTTDSRIFAHQCIYAGNASQNSNAVLRGLSARRRNGLFFIDVSGASPQAVLQGITTPYWKIVCQFRLTEPLVQGPFLRRVRQIYSAESCGFAVEVRNADFESMSILDSLRPHYIKIDQSLVKNIEEPRCADAVRRLVKAADQWGSIVVACGVRDQEQVEDLWLMGVRNMQGDFFGTPTSSIFPIQNAQSRLVYPVCAL